MGKPVHIATVSTERGPEIALVDPAAETIRPTGLFRPLESLLDSDGLNAIACAARNARPQPLDPEALLPPVHPRTIVGVGLNYRAHATEQRRELPAEPALFLKNPRSLAPPVGTLPLQPGSASLDYEAELGIVIGRPIFDCTLAEAEAAIVGWLVVNDYTLRDLARPETLPIAKGGLRMAPIGPWLTTTASVSVADAGNLAIRCAVNGEVRQDSTTADMHFGPVELVHRIARHLPLGPGDVIATGSPGGSGAGFSPPRWLVVGDTVTTTIDRLGRLQQRVVRNS